MRKGEGKDAETAGAMDFFCRLFDSLFQRAFILSGEPPLMPVGCGLGGGAHSVHQAQGVRMKSPVRLGKFGLCSIFLLLGLPSISQAAIDMFAQIDGVKGESVDAKHVQWIEILSFSHGMSMPSVTSSSGGRTASRVDHGDVIVEKMVDSTTPTLSLYCCQGKHIQRVRIEFCQPAGDKKCFLAIEMKDILITSVQTSAVASDPETAPKEKLNFSYSEIQWEFKPLSGGASVRTSWSVIQNMEK